MSALSVARLNDNTDKVIVVQFGKSSFCKSQTQTAKRPLIVSKRLHYRLGGSIVEKLQL